MTDIDQPGDGGQPGDGDAPAAPPDGGGKRPSRRLVVAVAAAVVLAGAGGVVAATRGGSCPSGGRILEVEGRSVSPEELLRRVELVQALYGLAPPEGPKGDDYRRELAKSMATAIIVDREAERRRIVVADRAARDALDRYIADFFPQGREQFTQAMGTKGVSEAEVLGEFRQIQTTFRLLDAVTEGATVTDAEVDGAYEQRRAELVLPERRRLAHLVVASRAEADAALARLRRGEAFPAVATAVTLDGTTKAAGGDLGPRAATELEPAFATEAFAAALRKPFGPVQTRFGWHVGQVEEVLPGHSLTREEASGALREQLMGERKLAAQRQYVAKLLRDAHVCYAERFRPTDPAAPPPDTPLSPPPDPPPLSPGPATSPSGPATGGPSPPGSPGR